MHNDRFIPEERNVRLVTNTRENIRVYWWLQTDDALIPCIILRRLNTDGSTMDYVGPYKGVDYTLFYE